MRVGFVEWPGGLLPDSAEWRRVVIEVAHARLPILVTNELPFGYWVAREPIFDRKAAQASVDLHDHGLQALSALSAPTIITSRPVVRSLHRKQYFPAEPGWYETSWFDPGEDDFPLVEVTGVAIDILLCTELMFNERARRLGRQGASLIAIPRATGAADMWRTADRMAAIVSGAYVVSSNRVSSAQEDPGFGGDGFAYGPDGALLASTNRASGLSVIEVDLDAAAIQKSAYPCYVSEVGPSR